jgi:mannose-6-phosphate isomerase-like protein (cupin superfamily)
MNIISTQAAEHYNWGEGCDGWHLMRSEECSVIEERMPPHTSEVSHFHNHSRQFFYVLAGQLTIEVDGKRLVLNANAGLEIAPQAVHRVFNDSDADVRFLVISSPPSHGDRVAPE